MIDRLGARFNLALPLLLTVASAAAAQQRDSVLVRGSRFEPHIEVAGPAYGVPENPNTTRLLRTFIDRKSGVTSHQVYVIDEYWAQTRRGWFQANDEQALPLELMEIAADVASCGGSGRCEYREEVAVTVSDSALRAFPNGYGIKLYARDGSQLVVTTTADQIRLQLQKVDSIVGTIITKPVGAARRS
jgi:hypothetical protein